VVYGKQGDDYLISDPVFPEPVTCPRRDLMKARFARGPMPPKGKMYYLNGVPREVDFQGAVKKGVREVCNTMLKVPLPYMGIRGIRYLAKRLQIWPERLGDNKAALHLGQIIRMQEEIGTGGGGFRFIYAAFLQEAARVLGMDALQEMSERMTHIGDQWRRFALIASRNCKKRASGTETYPAMADILRRCADGEEELYRDLARVVG